MTKRRHTPTSTDASPAALTRRARRSKQKGRQFERSVAERIAEWLGLKAGTDPTDPVQWSRSAFSGRDILLSPEAVEKLAFPCWFECKNCKTLSIPAWLRQMEEAQAKEGDTSQPVLVFKTHGDGTKYAVVNFDLFMALLTRGNNDEG